jgi:hypothetical protein
MLDMRGRVLEQTLTLTRIGTQLGDLAIGPKAGTWAEARTNEAAAATVHRDTGLAPRQMLGIAIDQKYSKAKRVKKLENRNPVDADRFHDNGLDATFREQVHQPMQGRP